MEGDGEAVSLETCCMSISDCYLFRSYSLILTWAAFMPSKSSPLSNSSRSLIIPSSWIIEGRGMAIKNICMYCVSHQLKQEHNDTQLSRGSHGLASNLTVSLGSTHLQNEDII